MDADQRSPPSSPADAVGGLRAAQLLRVRRIWILPLGLGVVFVALMSVIYLGSVVNPTGHIRGLPVMVVDEDRGADVDGHRVDIGASLLGALEHAAPVTERLALHPVTLERARLAMNKAAAYETLYIPPTLSRSALLAAGISTSGGPAPANAEVELEENLRLGSLGVSLASGVITPAVEKISAEIGRRLSRLASASARSDPVLAARVADPIELTDSSYRPLPDHSAVGLSAFYTALLAIMAGFLGATLINSSIDAALGYATTEIGPRWRQRRPVAINRRQTFLTKWAIAVLAAPILSGVLVLIAVEALGMYAPHAVLLWLLTALAALMIATGTLALLAALGALGQLLALILLVYLSLASSGGTVPIQALPGFFRVVAEVEPLRQVLDGTRAILYFGAQGDAGLTHSLVMLALELLFWGLLGLAVTGSYDRRGLDRISPDLLRYVEQAVEQRKSDSEVSAGALGRGETPSRE